MNWRLSQRIDLGGRIGPESGRRQQRTASEILRRFDGLPGVVLADEVGMGKTFVALAVAASVIDATGYRKPVLVMVPSAVGEKWPLEWDVFRSFCLGPGPEIRAGDRSIAKGSDLLKLLDDPPSRQAHIIFVTHGALTSSLLDPMVRMAIVRHVLKRPSLVAQRRAFPRRAGGVMRGGSGWWPEAFVSELLETAPREWRRVCNRHWRNPIDDDPVPKALLDALRRVELDALAEALRGLPLRAGPRLPSRLTAARRALDAAVDEVWRDCLHRLDLHLPLLILDEAHHTRNPGTRLARLFADRSAEHDVEALAGPLNGVFDRMLFLTATPFQLAHSELLEVLRRFQAVCWSDPGERATYRKQIDRLGTALDDTKTASLRFDDAWGRLDRAELVEHAGDRWWEDPASHQLPASMRRAADRFRVLRERNREAERLLRPLVIRHTRPDRDARRLYLEGAAIHTNHPSSRSGLQVAGEAVLPFLLAARTQAVVMMEARRHGGHARAHFAEGLASSFEAYRNTRSASDEGKDEDATVTPSTTLPDTADWYLREVDAALPAQDDSIWTTHPKVAATVERTVALWERGEKTLVFCFYVATGRALRRHISARLADAIVRLGAERLGLDPSERDEVLEQLRLFGDRFQDPKSPVFSRAEAALQAVLAPCDLPPEDLDRAVDIVRRFLRTPAFLVRYVALDTDRAEAVVDAIHAETSSGMALRERIEGFGRFLGSRTPEERKGLLDALADIPTGSVFASASHFDASEGVNGGENRLPNVRLANGGVRRGTRRLLMLAFNTPFFPEVLIASSVMAEGVDLHLNCRHVIHHDLDWNPSTLEQRTGRVDRLGSLSEVTGERIHIYEPFIEATQDEKLFRVVKDRERWFNFVMGQPLQLDEWSTERIAERPELPAEIASELAIDLSVVKTK